jgi:hypothetical protein
MAKFGPRNNAGIRYWQPEKYAPLDAHFHRTLHELRALQMEHQLSNKQWAERAGLDSMTLSNWFKSGIGNRGASVMNLEAAANVFNCGITVHPLWALRKKHNGLYMPAYYDHDLEREAENASRNVKGK